mmetsp:Transcript_72075/g.155723  ORF Transcript_72075/g.155723 Transcript_72075/m.155723 type:complete len:204 (-) Transcript_72075:466-1077(-)
MVPGEMDGVEQPPPVVEEEAVGVQGSRAEAEDFGREEAEGGGREEGGRRRGRGGRRRGEGGGRRGRRGRRGGEGGGGDQRRGPRRLRGGGRHGHRQRGAAVLEVCLRGLGTAQPAVRAAPPGARVQARLRGRGADRLQHGALGVLLQQVLQEGHEPEELRRRHRGERARHDQGHDRRLREGHRVPGHRRPGDQRGLREAHGGG